MSDLTILNFVTWELAAKKGPNLHWLDELLDEREAADSGHRVVSCPIRGVTEEVLVIYSVNTPNWSYRTKQEKDAIVLCELKKERPEWA